MLEERAFHAQAGRAALRHQGVHIQGSKALTTAACISNNTGMRTNSRPIMKFDRFGGVCRQLPNVREYPAAFAVHETQDLLFPCAQRRLGSFRLHQNALKFFLIRQGVDQDAGVA